MERCDHREIPHPLYLSDFLKMSFLKNKGRNQNIELEKKSWKNGECQGKQETGVLSIFLAPSELTYILESLVSPSKIESEEMPVQ